MLNPHITAMYKTTFNTNELPFSVVGMSDEMPYDSTVFRDMNKIMITQYEAEFKKNILKAIEDNKPDIILCHHLYLLTALTVDISKNCKVFAFCHGSDLRQMKAHNLKKEFIVNNIRKLDQIISLHDIQKDEISKIYGVDAKKIVSLGIGFDKKIFNTIQESRKSKKSETLDFIYTGKISHAKGVNYLVKAFSLLDLNTNIRLLLIGGGNGEEYENIVHMSKKSKNKILFLGKVEQSKLKEIYKQGYVFILPSLYEGLPLVLVEALACGLNVVSSDLPGIKDWFSEDINNSKRISYITVPTRVNQDQLEKKDREIFIDNIKNELYAAILEKDKIKIKLNLEKYTWQHLTSKLYSLLLYAYD